MSIGIVRGDGSQDFMACTIGASTEDQLERFWCLVKDQLELPQSFEWTKAEPSICLRTNILIRRSLIGKYPWEGYQEILHEVAHAIRPEAKMHGRDFYDTLAELIGRFLGYG